MGIIHFVIMFATNLELLTLLFFTFIVRCDKRRSVAATLFSRSNMDREDNIPVIDAIILVGLCDFLEIIKVVSLPELVDPFSLRPLMLFLELLQA